MTPVSLSAFLRARIADYGQLRRRKERRRMFRLHKRILPPLGMRIIKTAAAVYICLIFYWLQGFHGNVGSSIVTAIICMQPFAEDTRTFAFDRISGTILGAAWSLLFLELMDVFPVLGQYQLVVYGVMSLFVILAIYSTVVIRKSSLACLVAIVLVSTIVRWPDVEAPLTQTLTNLADTIVGTIIAIVVNIFTLPRRKHPEYLFFVRTMDLVPDRYRQIPSSVHITLDRMYKHGAKICLVSRWAPAFIISQMGLLNVNTPMIIMDGAALYDLQENAYLDVVDISRENAERLRGILAGFGVGVNLYTVNERTMTIFHDGPVNVEEKRECEDMKRSPYRQYADGLPREEDWIAFMRVIDSDENIERLAYQLRSVLPTGMFRMVERKDGRYPGTSGLYFYNPRATVENMKKRVLEIMEQKEKETLEPVDLLPRNTKYLPEHDAMLLLNRLRSLYEPMILLDRKKRNK